MTTEDILRLRDRGEASKVQFKERVLEDGLQVEFKNDERTHEFLITIQRNADLAADSDTTPVTDLDTVGPNLDTAKADSDTDLDTVGSNLDTAKADSDTDSDTVSADPDTLTSNSSTDSDTRRMKLTPKQKDVVNYCNVPRSSREILERAGVSYHSKNIQTYITSLVEAGYLEMTNPDNPNASNQKYRKK